MDLFYNVQNLLVMMMVTMMMMMMMMTVVEIVWRIKACGRPHTESTSGGWRHLKLYRLHIIKRRKQGGLLVYSYLTIVYYIICGELMMVQSI